MNVLIVLACVALIVYLFKPLTRLLFILMVMFGALVVIACAIGVAAFDKVFGSKK